MMLMKYMVAERKLQFLNKLRTKDKEDVARRTINNEILSGIKGLKLAKEVNIDDLYENRLTKKAIKTAVKKGKHTRSKVRGTKKQKSGRSLRGRR